MHDIQGTNSVKFGSHLINYITKFLYQSDIPKRITKYTYLRWSFIAAVCFSTTSRFLVEEGERGYVEIVELSIKDPDYGLNIPANISRVEEYVPRLFKSWVRCSNEIFAPFVHYIFELLPFSSEFFTLATFDAINTISNFGHSENTSLMEQHTNIQVDEFINTT